MAGRPVSVVVAGLGVMGSAVALHLARRGAKVIGFDRHAPPHPLGSSHGESRVIRQAYFEDPVYVPLVRRAQELWESLERETNRKLLHRTGALMVGPPSSRVLGGTLRSAEEHHVPHEVLSAAEIRARFPPFAPAAGDLGVYEPRAGVLLAEPCVSALIAAAVAHGADLRMNEPMISWSAEANGVRVSTAHGEHTADFLVLALGPWLPAWTPYLPLVVERQVMFWYRSAEGAALGPGACPVFLWEMPDQRMFYGVPDLGAGLKVAAHHGGVEIAPSQPLDPAATEADEEPVRRFLAQHLPAAAGDRLRSTVCRYTNTPDGHFLIDRLPDQPVWLVSPCSGHGFKFAPAVGESVAAWLTTGQKPPGIERFGRRWVG